MSDMPFHPVVDLFPPMSEEQFRGLVEDIKEHGVRVPVLVHDCKIVDGRHRWLACRELGITCPTETLDLPGESSVVSHVISLNAKRRHLTPSQLGMVATDALPLYEAEAAARKAANGGNRRSEVEIVPPPVDESKAKARDQAAAAVGVNARYVSDAKKIKAEAPDLADDVRSGKLTIPRAITEIKKREGKPHVANNSGENEWYTPPEIIEAARSVMGSIDTDPATSEVANRVVKAERWFTKDDDGLRQDWTGNVWLNPPYAQPLIGQFVDAIVRKYQDGEFDEACVLVNNATETRWGQALLGVSSSVCFLSGRVKFLDRDGVPAGAPLQGQMVVYIGDSDFAGVFRALGVVVRR